MIISSQIFRRQISKGVTLKRPGVRCLPAFAITFFLHVPRVMDWMHIRVQVLKKFADLLPDLPVLAFISLSKSVSRGLTTGGTIVANATAEVQWIVSRVGLE